jgi:uncharacterized membrane protein YebE (DUF533 family)
MRALDELDRDERLRLLRFVCSFAWADLHVQEEERALIAAMIRRLDFGAAERRQVDEWLELPPPPQDVDPTAVPLEHRRLFRSAIDATVRSDGRVTSEEREALALFDQLTRTMA